MSASQSSLMDAVQEIPGPKGGGNGPKHVTEPNSKPKSKSHRRICHFCKRSFCSKPSLEGHLARSGHTLERVRIDVREEDKELLEKTLKNFHAVRPSQHSSVVKIIGGGGSGASPGPSTTSPKCPNDDNDILKIVVWMVITIGIAVAGRYGLGGDGIGG